MHSITHIFEDGIPLQKPRNILRANGSMRSLVDNEEGQATFIKALAAQVPGVDCYFVQSPGGDLWLTFPYAASHFYVDCWKDDAIHRAYAMAQAIAHEMWARAEELVSL